MRTVEDITDKVILGDARKVLQTFPGDSIDMCITSPPYFGQRSYGGLEFEMGSEKSVGEYISQMGIVFDEVKRVLKPTGTCWVNIGDKYHGGELYGVPEKFVVHMMLHGWSRFNTVIWHKCLDGDTGLIAMRDGRIVFTKASELFTNCDNVKLPSQDTYGNIVWVNVNDVFYTGERERIKITTKSGRSVICTPEHRFVVKRSATTVRTGCVNRRRSRKIKLKPAGELTPKDYIYVNVDLPTASDEIVYSNYSDGFIIGFFIAEGNWIYNKHGDKKGVQFACGVKDIDRGYIDILLKYDIKKYVYGNNVCIRSYDKELLRMLDNAVGGRVCSDKYLKSDLETTIVSGVIDGFLAGDGYYSSKEDRYVVGIKPNATFSEQVSAMCRVLGYDYRVQPIRKNSEGYEVMSMTIRKNTDTRNVFMGCVVDNVESVENVGYGDCYDISIEPIYYTHHGKGVGTSPSIRREMGAYNHLYFLANGMWTHNSNAFTGSSKKRFNQDFEYLYAFSKGGSYYFDQQYDPYKTVYKSFDYTGKAKKDYKLDGAQDPSEAKRSILRSMANGKGRIKRCVWSIVHGSSAHTASFPRDLVHSPILAGSPHGGLVLDPFCGSGVSLRVALETGRKYVGIDLNPKSVEMAQTLVDTSC